MYFLRLFSRSQSLSCLWPLYPSHLCFPWCYFCRIYFSFQHHSHAAPPSPPLPIPLPELPTPTSHPTTPTSHTPAIPSPHPDLSPITQPPLSRPMRTLTCPQYLNDYICCLLPHESNRNSPSGCSSLGNPHSLACFLFYTHFNSKHLTFLLTLSEHNEPTNYSQAMHYSYWCDAMAYEIQALEANNTLTLQTLPHNKKPIGYKWVFKTNLRPTTLLRDTRLA